MKFEQALAKLEQVVKQLENKDIELEEAVNLYNKGLELSKLCYNQLKESEKLIAKAMTDSGLENIKVED